MPRFVDERSWMTAFEEHRRTGSIRQAALKAGIDYSALRKLYSGTAQEKAKSTGWLVYQRFLADNPPGVIKREDLNPEALAALEDIHLFALRYFGIVLRPWQVDAAERIVAALETQTKEYVLMNGPPGTGKSSFYTWILICWLICRDRSITIQLGSGSQRVAENHTERIRMTLERPSPIVWSDEDKRLWGSQDAEATLVEDFGRFKPENSRRWRAEEFVVATEGDVIGTAKEPTVAAWGPDGVFIGTRYRFIIWDDLVNKRSSGTIAMRDKTVEFWESEAETRLNMGGVLVLQGQRLYNDDLYSYVSKQTRPLDAEDLDGIDDPENTHEVPAYQHVVYRAHYEDLCTNPTIMHRRDAPAHDPKDPGSTSCLLDPRNVSWRELQRIRGRNEVRYQLTYQQDDSMTSNRLIEPEWINGTGTGGQGGYRGCWDEDRSLGQYPTGLAKPWLHVISCDPSGEKYWSVQDWIYHPATETRYLVNLVRKPMTSGQFLDLNSTNGIYTGLCEEWAQMGKKNKFPVDAIVLEENATQKWFFQFEWSRQWLSSRGVTMEPHQTQRNKADPELGIQSLLPPQYEYGRVRFPGNRLDGSRATIMKMVDELTHWPEARTSDCVMAHWFFEFKMPKLLKQKKFRDRPRTDSAALPPKWVQELTLPAYLSA